MSLFKRIIVMAKASRQLGLRPMVLYAGYQIKLRSGWLRWKTPAGGRKMFGEAREPKIILQPATKKGLQRLLGRQTTQMLQDTH